jgi:hypothetical protein
MYNNKPVWLVPESGIFLHGQLLKAETITYLTIGNLGIQTNSKDDDISDFFVHRQLKTTFNRTTNQS